MWSWLQLFLRAGKALLAITTYTTIINAVINSVIAVVLYAALRPALKKAGFITAERA